MLIIQNKFRIFARSKVLNILSINQDIIKEETSNS